MGDSFLVSGSCSDRIPRILLHPHIMESPLGKVTIIGSGVIGRCWATLFAKAGYSVCMYDVNDDQLSVGLASARAQLCNFESQGLLQHCQVKNAEAASQLITTSLDLADAIKDAMYVQECVPENVDLKREVFTKLDGLVTDDQIILASSSSCIGPSQFCNELNHVAQCLVAHPINPPSYIKLVEVVSSEATRADVVDRTVTILRSIGQSPVVARKEVNGFILNRLQYAVIMEAWRMVEDGVCSPEDIDVTMKEGLAPRYTLLGPFETMHLNAEGIRNYCERYGDGIERVCGEQMNIRKMGGETLATVEAAMLKQVPIEELGAKRQWRDSRLAELSKHFADKD